MQATRQITPNLDTLTAFFWRARTRNCRRRVRATLEMFVALRKSRDCPAVKMSALPSNDYPKTGSVEEAKVSRPGKRKAPLKLMELRARRTDKYILRTQARLEMENLKRQVVPVMPEPSTRTENSRVRRQRWLAMRLARESNRDSRLAARDAWADEVVPPVREDGLYFLAGRGVDDERWFPYEHFSGWGTPRAQYERLSRRRGDSKPWGSEDRTCYVVDWSPSDNIRAPAQFKDLIWNEEQVIFKKVVREKSAVPVREETREFVIPIFMRSGGGAIYDWGLGVGKLGGCHGWQVREIRSRLVQQAVAVGENDDPPEESELRMFPQFSGTPWEN